ncbi:flippase-like domain-containing protein [bacterium]|nr:flippase-like domain-containing protein [bacterium]
MRFQWHKKQTAFLIRLIISAALIYFLIHTADTRSLIDTLLSADWRLFALAMLFSLAKQGIEIVRLFLLFRVRDIHLPVWTVVKIMMTGTFLGTVSPTSLSTEIFRAYGFAQHMEDSAHAVSAVAINRFIGLFSLMVLATVSSLWQPEYARSIGAVWLAVVFSMPLFLLALGFSRKFRHLFEHPVFQKIDFIARTVAWLANVARSMFAYRRHRLMLAVVFVLSIIFQSVRVIVTYLLALALDVHIPLAYFFIITPIVLLFTTLPLSVGGIGIREGGTVYFLGKIGIPPTQAFSVSIMWFLAALTSSVPGFFFYLIEGFGGKRKGRKQEQRTKNEERRTKNED